MVLVMLLVAWIPLSVSEEVHGKVQTSVGLYGCEVWLGRCWMGLGGDEWCYTTEYYTCKADEDCESEECFDTDYDYDYFPDAYGDPHPDYFLVQL